MASYRLSPLVHHLESQLIPGRPEYGIFHQLTGEVLQPGRTVRSLLFAARAGNQISVTEEDLERLENVGSELRSLINREFLVTNDQNLLISLLDWVVVRPIQNPAVTYRSDNGNLVLVRVSMSRRIYSPNRDQLSPVIEEEMPLLAGDIWLAADGARTLQEIGAQLCSPLEEDSTFRAALEYLSSPERQLIKLARPDNDLEDPFQPYNTVPRHFFHSSRWQSESHETANTIVDFHREGIEDALWEFDVIEPTINHALRFASDVLSGMNYGSRFCDATLSPEIMGAAELAELEILEIGGGTGDFARSFLDQANGSNSTRAVKSYTIVDLSPALIENQRRVLSGFHPRVSHVEQDATRLDLGSAKFDLIIANEVIADFPVSMVERACLDQAGVNDNLSEGAGYVRKYNLEIQDAPDRFFINRGVFDFLERAWDYLKPGGTLMLSEYGDAAAYPAEGFHLNHQEFSIHFGHVMTCARKIGFDCRLYSLKDFLKADDQRPVLSGREEHLRCLNHIFKKFGRRMPFALFSEREFRARFQDLIDGIELTGVGFSPMRNNFHYGPNLNEFLVLVLNRPVCNKN